MNNNNRLEFNEDSDEYKILTVLHVKYAGILCGFFGLIGIVSAFGCGVAFFPWSSYDTAFDVIASTGFFIFLISGVVVHYLVLHAIHFTRFRLICPFLFYHCFLISLMTVTALIAVGELVADQSADLDDGDLAARAVLCTVPPTVTIQLFMIVLVAKCRHYLRNKRRHIRNGLPPPIREVVTHHNHAISFQNKIFAQSEISIQVESTQSSVIGTRDKS